MLEKLKGFDTPSITNVVATYPRNPLCWVFTNPGGQIGINIPVVYGVNMFGAAVRDLLDPRLRGGSGRYGVRGTKKEAKK